MKDDNRKRAIAALLVIAAATFGASYAYGRMSVDPTGSEAYRMLDARIATAKHDIADNRRETAKLTRQREELRTQLTQERTAGAEAREQAGRYVPEGSVGDQPLALESLEITNEPRPYLSGLETTITLTVRNTSGHILTGVGAKGVITRADGSVAKNDVYISASYVRVYPGRTVVCDAVYDDAGYSGGTLTLGEYFATTAQDGGKQTEGTFTGDAAKKVIP